MAISGIGNKGWGENGAVNAAPLKSLAPNGANALEKFQAIRDQAKKKIDGDDNRIKLADLLKQKQNEFKAGAPSKADDLVGMVEKFKNDLGALSSSSKGLMGAQAFSGYGRAGATEKSDPKPMLGRYIDFMA